MVIPPNPLATCSLFGVFLTGRLNIFCFLNADGNAFLFGIIAKEISGKESERSLA